MLAGCRGRWRVFLDPDVVKFFEKRELLGELQEWRRELEESLNRDPAEIVRLLREPILYEVDGVKRRRYCLYLRGKGYRLVYIIYPTLCTVYFALSEKRDEETYKRLRRRRR